MVFYFVKDLFTYLLTVENCGEKLCLLIHSPSDCQQLDGGPVQSLELYCGLTIWQRAKYWDPQTCLTQARNKIL